MASLFSQKCKDPVGSLDKEKCYTMTGVSIAVVMCVIVVCFGVVKWYHSDVPIDAPNNADANLRRKKGRNGKILRNVVIVCVLLLIIVPIIVREIKKINLP